MKRFVRNPWGLIILGTIATVATVALTQASAGVSYLILLGYLAVVLVWMRVANLPEEWTKEPTGEARNRGSR
jgi:O-antigen ligase